MSFPNWENKNSPEVLSHRGIIKLNGNFFLITALPVQKIMTVFPPLNGRDTGSLVAMEVR
ncbi:MAG: hypothetical protein GYB55_15310 [Cytophagales bacterium]|uniref:hypothetical protein n=1 Tax=Cyclobacterium marinum TaxID=104 RepID=UPI0030DA3721|nr:hypothetical protein [Cytophagales bacterium]|tara:strand:- start:4445 stop:4624 length:180 start_codon:yes stop_codon:yes gene_type:complete